MHLTRKPLNLEKCCRVFTVNLAMAQRLTVMVLKPLRDTKMGSFLSADFLAQKPGEVFYKTTFGRKDMPKFEKKISDDEKRWSLVYYIMHLKD